MLLGRVTSDNDATEKESHADKVQLVKLLLEDKVESNSCNEGSERVEVHGQTVIEASSGGSVHHTNLE